MLVSHHYFVHAVVVLPLGKLEQLLGSQSDLVLVKSRLSPHDLSS